MHRCPGNAWRHRESAHETMARLCLGTRSSGTTGRIPTGPRCPLRRVPCNTQVLPLPLVLRKESGMSRLTVAPSTQVLLRLVDGPAMLSKHVQIGKYIVDAVIIDVHPEVAQWYGYKC